jgi:hypothetical protein
MTRIAATLRRESGEGLVSGLVVLAGVLLPLLFIVPLFARIESAHLTADQAARDAARSAVEAPSADRAQAAADAAVDRSRAWSNASLRLRLAGSYSRGEALTAHVTADVPIGSLPLLGRFGTVRVQGRASAPIDRYRSILRPEER